MFKKLSILSGIIGISKLALWASVIWCFIYNILYFTSYTFVQVDNTIVKQYDWDYNYNSLIAVGISVAVFIITSIASFFIGAKEVRNEANNILKSINEDSKEFFGKDLKF